MAEERVQRRLAAILAADVVGYSRLIGMDEEGTIARLKAALEELIDPNIARHQGRIVKTTGDGLLVEFPSVVDAVRCAVAVQRGLTEREADEREERRIELRVIDALRLTDTAPDRLRRVLRNAAVAADNLSGEQLERRGQLLHLLVHRVTLHAGSIRIDIKRSCLNTLVSGTSPVRAEHPSTGAKSGEDLVDLIAPIRLRRRGVEAKLVVGAARDRPARPDQKLAALVAKAFLYMDGLAEGRAKTVSELALQHEISASDVSQTLPLAFLAPDIIESIVSGRQPFELRAHKLKRNSAIPFSWVEQRRLLGFSR